MAIPMTPPSSRTALLAPDATPSSEAATEPRIMLETGTKNRDMPTPQMTNGANRVPKVTPGLSTAAHQARHRSAVQGQTGDHERAPPDPVGKGTGDGSDEEGHGRPGQDPQSGRRAARGAGRGCRIWASRKIDPKIPKLNSSEATLAALKVRSRNRRRGTWGWTYAFHGRRTPR